MADPLHARRSSTVPRCSRRTVRRERLERGARRGQARQILSRGAPNRTCVSAWKKGSVAVPAGPREIESRLGIADRLATCVPDPQAVGRVVHGIDDILRFRMLMIAAGWEDGNDADSLRHDSACMLTLGRLPEGVALCSQPTISRDLLRMARPW